MPQLRRSNLQLYGFISTVLFIGTVLNAFRQRSNFYSAAVYLSKSNGCMMILWNQGIFQTVLVGKLLQSAFFGPLRPLEIERLQERGWFAVTETLLALTIFRDEFDSAFILLFVSLLFLKVFHWLAADRVELMEQSTNVSRTFHARMISLLTTLWIADVCFLVYAVQSIMADGPSVVIMFASEYMVLIATALSLSLKYGINVVDLRSEEEWEQKSMLVFYVELVTDFVKLVTYLVFFCVILTFYGLPLNILRDVYLTTTSFVLKCRDLIRFRKATKNMETLYPDVGEIEMRDMIDKTCIICREDMEFRGIPAIIPPVEGAVDPPPPVPVAPRTGPNDTPKKLPCGHVFHFHCLRSWLERQQSCPTCRRSVLETNPAPTFQEAARNQRRGADAVAEPVGAAQAARLRKEEVIRQAQVNLARNLGREAFNTIFPGVPFPEEALLPPPALPSPAVLTDPATPTPTPTTSDAAASSSSSAAPQLPTAPPINPLAMFSLPDLPLPPSGEAGLFSPPPVLSSENYANLAFGGSLSSVGTATRAGATMTVGLGSSSVARKKEQAPKSLAEAISRTSSSVASTSASTLPPPPSAVPSPAAVTPSTEPTPSPISVVEEATLNPREAALAAAERRRVASSSASKSISPPPPTVLTPSTSPPLPETSLPTVSSVEETPAPIPSRASSPSILSKSDRIPIPTQYTRIIPLSAFTSGSSLLDINSISFPPVVGVPSNDVLTVMRDFQKRLQTLNDEFAVVMKAFESASIVENEGESLEEGEDEVSQEEAEVKVDKGKGKETIEESSVLA